MYLNSCPGVSPGWHYTVLVAEPVGPWTDVLLSILQINYWRCVTWIRQANMCVILICCITNFYHWGRNVDDKMLLSDETIYYPSAESSWFNNGFNLLKDNKIAFFNAITKTAAAVFNKYWTKKATGYIAQRYLKILERKVLFIFTGGKSPKINYIN